MEPYAVYLLRRFRAGERLQQLVVTEGMPCDRIIVRLIAAVRFERAQKRARIQSLPREAAA